MIYVEKGNEGYTIDEKNLGEYTARGFKQPQVSLPAADIGGMTIDELKAYAEGKGIDLTGLTKKEDILAKIKGGQ